MMKTGTRHFLGWLVGLIPAGVLLYAGFLKGLDPFLFADQITGHRLTPESWSMPLAYLFVAVELLIGLALLLRLWPQKTHISFVALMLGFIVATSIAWAQGNTQDCGCFGRAVSRGPLQVILEDAILIVLSLLALWLLRGARTPRRSGIVAGILVPIVLAFTAAGAQLPADGLVTGIHRGSDLADLPVEGLRRSHTEGTVLLVLLGGDCTECADAVPALNEIARTTKGRLRLAAVYSGTGKEAMAWRMKRLPAFPVAHASPRALRAYYRSLPTSLLLREGRLVRAFWGRIPEASELAAAEGDR